MSWLARRSWLLTLTHRRGRRGHPSHGAPPACATAPGGVMALDRHGPHAHHGDDVGAPRRLGLAPCTLANPEPRPPSLWAKSAELANARSDGDHPRPACGLRPSVAEAGAPTSRSFVLVTLGKATGPEKKECTIVCALDCSTHLQACLISMSDLLPAVW